jgi:hypothetical protein
MHSIEKDLSGELHSDLQGRDSNFSLVFLADKGDDPVALSNVANFRQNDPVEDTGSGKVQFKIVG